MNIPWRMLARAKRIAIGGVFAIAILATSAEASNGGLHVALNLGADFPPGEYTFGPGGVWQVAAGLSPSRSLALTVELGTAANDIETSRRIQYGGSRTSSLHLTSTLAILARRAFGVGKLRPHIALGSGWYTEWDELEATPSQPAINLYRDGPAIQAGGGLTLWMGAHWDLLGEAIYNLALDAGEEARFAMLRSGIRYHLGHRTR